MKAPKKTSVFTNRIPALMISLIVILVISSGHAETLNGTSPETLTGKTLSPYFFIENGDPAIDQFPLKSTRAEVNINGVIADVVVTQEYENNGTRPINAKYIFPASTRAAVHGMEMRSGDEVIKAKIEERQEATKKFEAAKKAGKSASLLNQQRPNVFSMNVANVMPGDTIAIELRYTELLVPTDGTYEFVYPTVVGPRYSSQPEAGALKTDLWVKNPYLKEGKPPPARFDIVCNLSTGIPLSEISSNSHDINIAWEDKSIAKVMLKDPEDYGGNRDVILHYRLLGKKINSGLILYEDDMEKFFLLTVQPPECVRTKDIPPREYIFVVDISGSMNGFPLNTAKELLKNLISDLRPTDKFNVILFAGGSKVMSPRSVSATSANIYSAIRLIENQQGGGGTELFSALKRGINIPADEAFSRSIIIVTDGYITAEREVFDLIEKNLNRANLFSFGIGSSVNRYLIEGMAKAGLGEPFVVTRPADAGAVADRFKDYVNSPVLTNIRVVYDGFDTYDVEPAAIPDLFAQRPVMIFGKWRDKAAGTITLTGVGGKSPYRLTADVSETPVLEKNSALKYLWARTRIARLSDYNVNRNNPDNKAQITSLGLTYNLLTEHTSFLAVHEVIRNRQANAKDVIQPLPLPKHVSNLAVGGSCSSVPEPELVWLFGVLLFLAAIHQIRKRKPAGMEI